MNLRQLWSRLAALSRGRRLDRELDDEIRAHLELAERDGRARGLTPAEARREARLRFGSIEGIKEDQRDVRRPRLLEATWRDLRYARRRLARRPAFFATAVLTLAVGVGASTLAFSAVRGLLFGSLAVPDADRVVWIHANNRAPGVTGEGLWSHDVEALATTRGAFTDVGVIGAVGRVLAVGDRRVEWRGLWVTTSLADVLKIRPAAGRAFTDADAGSTTAAPAMMIGYERWIADFAGDPAIIGRTIRFEDNKPHTIVGVLPRGLAFPEGRSPGAGSGSEFPLGVQDFWTLGQSAPRQYPGGMTVARLADGVRIEQASEAAARIGAVVAEAHPELATRVFSLTTLRDYSLGAMRRGVPVLQAGAILLLAIAAANLACLMLARGRTTRDELSLRAVLGASRGDLARVIAAECAWIAGGGAMLGLLVAWTGREWLGYAAAGRLPLVDRIAVDSVVVAAAVASAIAATFICGLAAVAAALPRGQAAASIDRAGRGQTAGRFLSRTLDALLVTQVALAVVLLTGASLLAGSVARLLAVDTGYDSRRVIAADVLLYEPPKTFVPFFVKLHARLTSLPGIDAVGLIQSTPLTGKWNFRDRVETDDTTGGERRTVDMSGSLVAFDYFAAMGVPLVAGRAFTHEEFTTSGRRVLIINDVAARRLFDDDPPVGRRVRMLGESHEIVGVVKGTRDVRLETPAEPQWYQPAFFGGSQIVVRTSGDPRAFVDVLRRELAGADARLVVKRVEPLGEIIAGSVVDRRLSMQVLVAFAAIALLLAVVGLFGVVSFRTAERRREFGVRVALGSSRSALTGLVFTQGAVLAIAGIAIGVFSAVPLSYALESLLFGVAPGDAAPIALAALTLLIAAIAACAWPAWRAGAVDPLSVLRE